MLETGRVRRGEAVVVKRRIWGELPVPKGGFQEDWRGTLDKDIE